MVGLFYEFKEVYILKMVWLCEKFSLKAQGLEFEDNMDSLDGAQERELKELEMQEERLKIKNFNHENNFFTM